MNLEMLAGRRPYDEKHSAKSRALAAGFYIDLPQSAETCVNPDN
jgi:hypothetical protein